MSVPDPKAPRLPTRAAARHATRAATDERGVDTAWRHTGERPPPPKPPPLTDLTESDLPSMSGFDSAAPQFRAPANDPPPSPGIADSNALSTTDVEALDDVEQTSHWIAPRQQAPNGPTRVSSGMTDADLNTSLAAPTRVAPNMSPVERPTREPGDTNWRTRVGSQFTGYEGLSEPGSEQPRLRLTLGRVVPGTRYRILKWLGEGGMGVVYEAEHVDIERRVALKILRFDLSCQPHMTRVFRDEAKAATKIGSPYIVDIFDFGELSDGRLYFCMELIDGHDLVPESTEHWTDPATLIGHLRQICKGLGDAHAAGIVHRDIKPENILEYPSEGRQAIKLVDFGISSMLAATGNNSSNGAGTPHYMAPEQINGGEFDGRLDIYALGCTAYELLTGYPPFDSEDVGELLGRHLTELPRPLNEARPDRDIPPQLSAVIMRCLSKDPQERYANMADLEAALCEAQIAAGLTTPWDALPLPEVDAERRERLIDLMPGPALPRQRRRWLWPSLAATSTLAALGLAIVLGRQPTPQHELDRIEELSQQAINAGARTYFFYPPPEDPQSTFTSYFSVLQLENLPEEAAHDGRIRAAELREQFAQALVSLGNRYWSAEGGKRWAYEYYAQALVFDPDNAQARERNKVSEAGLAHMREKASQRGYTRDELELTELSNIMAEADDEKREQRIKKAILERTGSVVQSNLAKRAMVVSHSRARSEAQTSPDAGEREAPDLNAEQSKAAEDALLAELERSTAAPTVVRPPRGTRDRQGNGRTRPGKSARANAVDPDTTTSVRENRSRRDPKRAKQLVHSGEIARKRGQRVRAEQLFHKAISHDRRNARALMGLSEIHFDRGEYEEQVKYAERAVDISPEDRNYRMKLGDAYYKVLRYRDALTQYRQAQRLGHKRAKDRIEKVANRLGREG